MTVPTLTIKILHVGTSHIHLTFGTVLGIAYRNLITLVLEPETTFHRMGTRIRLGTAFVAKISCQIQDRLLR